MGKMDYDKLYYKGGFMESLHYLLMKSHAMLSHRILSEASRLGLTPGQPKVLEFLLRHGESDQKTIAAYCEIEPATVGSTLLRFQLLQFPAAVLVGQITKRFQPLMKMLERAVL